MPGWLQAAKSLLQVILTQPCFALPGEAAQNTTAAARLAGSPPGLFSHVATIVLAGMECKGEERGESIPLLVVEFHWRQRAFS